MKQDIENIIKKNLPENRKHIHGKECKNYEECEKFSLFERASENALSQINTSLIADEVLKVVVENYKLEFEKLNFLTFGLNNKLYIQKNKVLQLLNNLK